MYWRFQAKEEIFFLDISSLIPRFNKSHSESKITYNLQNDKVSPDNLGRTLYLFSILIISDLRDKEKLKYTTYKRHIDKISLYTNATKWVALLAL
jgi:hypothetical protein